MHSWLLYPFTLGLVAAVNPCGFPLLPVYLSLFIEGEEGTTLPPLTKVRRGLTAGLYATAGFVLLFGIVGTLSEAGLSGTYDLTSSWARYPLVALGIALTAYGGITIMGRTAKLRLPQIHPGIAQRRPLAIALFGISYGVASLGCSLPLFLGGVASTFSHRGIARGVETFVAYAVGMGLLLTIAALVMSVGALATVRRFRLLSPFVGPLGGVILVAIGIYVTTYWVSAIVSPTSSTPVLRFIENVQGHVASFLQFHATQFGAIFGLVLVGGAVILVLLDRPVKHRGEPSDTRVNDSVV